MTELDEEFIALALEIIEEFGKVFDYTIIGESNYDPETQTNSTDQTVMPGIKMAPPEDASGYSVANGLAEMGDKIILVPAAYFIKVDAKPTPEDICAFDSEIWTVKEVKSYFSGELACLYQLRIAS